ncbi:MAG: alanine racemase, partial [Gemmatimonadales bacterium]
AWIGATDRPFHLEVDTGMARSGVRWDDSGALAEARALLPGAVGWEGVFTHFHSPDTDPAATRVQWDRFQSAVSGFHRRPELVHAANSAAALRGSVYAGDLIRPGIFLYGGSAGFPAPRPVAYLRTRVVGLRTVPQGETVSYGATWAAERDTTVATLAIGYADGVPRALGNRGSVEIRGQVLPIVGRVTMDMTMIAPAGGCAIGDVASLYGGLVSLDAQADAGQTISYELLTAIGARVARRYSLDP